jgi:hypothetical protein
MFRRVILESWHEYVPYICFALIGGVFILIVARALLMPKAQVQRLASMPLRDDDELLAGQSADTTTNTNTVSDSDKESR